MVSGCGEERVMRRTMVMSEYSIGASSINGDGSVTFRLAAPEAQRVSVSGDFISAADGTAFGGGEMVRNGDGVWEYTTLPLASELYTYSFNVDGVRICDPTNGHISRNVSTLSSELIIGGGRGDYYRVNDVPHGTVRSCWYHSDSYGCDRRMMVYTPPGYESGGRYPVLYLLHGAGNDEGSWLELGRVEEIVDNMIARGECRPMIVVMPNGNAFKQAADISAAEGTALKWSDRKPLNPMLEVSFAEVVDYVDGTFRTVDGKRGRAIAGLSMGGGQTSIISYSLPDTFDYVGLFSAAVGAVTDEQNDAKIKAQRDNGLKLYWIACGTEDFLYDGNRQYMSYLDSIGFPYVYCESDGGHIWRNWRIYLSEFAPMLFRK